MRPRLIGPEGPLGRALRGAHGAEPVTGSDGAVMVREDATGCAAAARHAFESEIVGGLAAAVLVIRADDGCIVYANTAAERLYGYRADELEGHHASCLSVASDEPPGQRSSEIAAAVAVGQVWTGDVQGRRSDGTPIWTTVRVSGLEHPAYGPVWVCVHAEAAPRLAAEETAREAETRFRAVFDSVFVAMVLIGRDLCILDANRAASTLTGLSREELTGRSLADVTHADDVGPDAGLAARLFAGKIGEYAAEQRIATGGGRYVATAVTVTAVGAPGQPAYALATLQTVDRPARAVRWARTASC
jgi:PAS domain S-box-containing protein